MLGRLDEEQKRSCLEKVLIILNDHELYPKDLKLILERLFHNSGIFGVVEFRQRRVSQGIAVGFFCLTHFIVE